MATATSISSRSSSADGRPRQGPGRLAGRRARHVLHFPCGNGKPSAFPRWGPSAWLAAVMACPSPPPASTPPSRPGSPRPRPRARWRCRWNGSRPWRGISPPTPRSPSALTTARQWSPPAGPGSSCRCFRSPTCPSAHILGEETGRVELDAKIARDLFARPAFAAADRGIPPVPSTAFSCTTSATILPRSPPMDSGSAVSRRRPRRRSRTDRSLIIPSEMVKTINRLLGNASGNVTLRRSERLFSVEGIGIRARQHEGRCDLSRL